MAIGQESAGDHTHWTIRELARISGATEAKIRDLWDLGLQPDVILIAAHFLVREGGKLSGDHLRA